MSGVVSSNTGLVSSKYFSIYENYYDDSGSIDMSRYRRIAFLVVLTYSWKGYVRFQYSFDENKWTDYTSYYHDGNSYQQYGFELDSAYPFWRVKIELTDGSGYVYYSIARRN